MIILKASTSAEKGPHADRKRRGFLVTFEGIGGSGKSTLAVFAAQWLSRNGVPITTTREPGSTSLGSALRTLLLTGKDREAPSPWAEAFLFEADRAQAYARVIEPALTAGRVVVSDRNFYGTIAYQVFGRGLDLKLIQAMSRAAMAGRYPDLILVVDIDPMVGLGRKAGSTERDRFDEQKLAFQEAARKGFLWAAKRDPGLAIVLDGSKPLDELKEQVRDQLGQLMGAQYPQIRSGP